MSRLQASFTAQTTPRNRWQGKTIVILLMRSAIDYMHLSARLRLVENYPEFTTYPEQAGATAKKKLHLCHKATISGPVIFNIHLLSY